MRLQKVPTIELLANQTNTMPRDSKIQKWPFRPSDRNQSSSNNIPDFELNQSLAYALDDEELSAELIDRFRQQGEMGGSFIQSFSSIFHVSEEKRHEHTWLVAGYNEVKEAVMNRSSHFSNTPYAELGGSNFMLALDPFDNNETPGSAQKYLLQRNYLEEILKFPEEEKLSRLANAAVSHAVISGLTHNRFDLAELSEQAAVRFCSLWLGFSGKDHVLIEKVAMLGYQALVHVVIGKHFTDNESAVVKAQKGMVILTERVAELIAEYRRVSWEPNEVHGSLKQRSRRANWPEGVTPLDELGLDADDFPILKRMALNPGIFSIAELAAMVTGVIVGTVGNVQASSCLSIRQVFSDPDKIETIVKEAHDNQAQVHEGALHSRVGTCLAHYPPVPFLPRRASEDFKFRGQDIKKGEEIVLWLAAASRLEKLKYDEKKFGLPFGAPEKKLKQTSTANDPTQAHSCTGTTTAHALVTAIVGTVLRLPSVAEVMDPVTGNAQGLTRRFGFACESYPLTHKRAMRIAQQPLNLFMRVKTPTDEHSAILKDIIRVGAPRIHKVLSQSSHVHFAWFQLLDQGRVLALHTVYDGDFDAYVQDFALKVDDLFDLILQHIEDAPPLPVAENMRAFVETVRAHDLPIVNGYFFSAAPRAEASEVVARFSKRP